MIFPKELKYSSEHTWVRVEGDKATIGITDFAQSWIGDLLDVDLFEEGSEIEPLGLFGILETSKVSFELYSPIGGTIIEKNNKLVDQITLINRDPYGEGWMILLQLRDTKDLGNLMDVDTYKKYIKQWETIERNVK
jgi:glycine cleavage system H protein